jgi:hypothetical protein
LALELLAAMYQRITERETGAHRPISIDSPESDSKPNYQGQRVAYVIE